MSASRPSSVNPSNSGSTLLKSSYGAVPPPDRWKMSSPSPMWPASATRSAMLSMWSFNPKASGMTMTAVAGDLLAGVAS
jgi:hypothetical protein